MYQVIKCTMNDDLIKEAIKMAFRSGYEACHKRIRNEYPMDEKKECENIFKYIDRKFIKIKE